MDEDIDLVLVIAPPWRSHRRLAKLVATGDLGDAQSRSSATATIYRDESRDEVRLGTPVVEKGTPGPLAQALRRALCRAWHQGAALRFVGPDGGPATEQQVLAALRRISKGRSPRPAG